MNSQKVKQLYLPGKALIAIILILTCVAAMSLSPASAPASNLADMPPLKKDSVRSVKAFQEVYTVLMSARCMNCHPAGNIPLQGDDNHLHAMFPKRGVDGRGLTAMKCANCHQTTSPAGLHMPPGNPNWHLPPADMKMVFQGRTAHQLAKQIMDQKQNGHKNFEQLLKHADDTLVVAAWNPAGGRTLPPLSRKDFRKAWRTWLLTGAFAPNGK